MKCRQNWGFATVFLLGAALAFSGNLSQSGNSHVAAATVSRNQAPTLRVKNSTLARGSYWSAQQNFVSATNNKGQAVSAAAVAHKGNVNRLKNGIYKVTFRYAGLTRVATVTVKNVTTYKNQTLNKTDKGQIISATAGLHRLSSNLTSKISKDAFGNTVITKITSVIWHKPVLSTQTTTTNELRDANNHLQPISNTQGDQKVQSQIVSSRKVTAANGDITIYQQEVVEWIKPQQNPTTTWVDDWGNELRPKSSGLHPDTDHNDVPGYHWVATEVHANGLVNRYSNQSTGKITGYKLPDGCLHYQTIGQATFEIDSTQSGAAKSQQTYFGKVNAPELGASTLKNDHAIWTRNLVSKGYYSLNGAQMQVLQQALPQIMVQGQVSMTSSAYQKYVAVRNWLTSQAYHTAKGDAVISMLKHQGGGVCQDYTATAVALLNVMGVPAQALVSNASFNHEWLAVKLSGAWYESDLTWESGMTTALVASNTPTGQGLSRLNSGTWYYWNSKKAPASDILYHQIPAAFQYVAGDLMSDSMMQRYHINGHGQVNPSVADFYGNFPARLAVKAYAQVKNGHFLSTFVTDHSHIGG